jgi:hypothetical protein
MTAIDMITPQNPQLIFGALGKIIDVADKGSVITTDHCVSILIKLCAVKDFADDVFALLIEKLQGCPTNQLPMYAERAIPVINTGNKIQFVNVLVSRLGEIEKDTKKKRVEKVIKRVE